MKRSNAGVHPVNLESSISGGGVRAIAAVLALVVAATASAQNLSDRLAQVAEMRRQEASRDVTGASLLGALLYTDINVDFQATKAKDAIDYISKALGVPLVARYTSDRGASSGIDPETEITLKSDNKPALSVLEQVLEQCGVDDPCTWQLRGSFIEVGTKERLSVPAAREVRMYPIRDLIFEPPLFDNAPNFNLNQAIQQGNNGTGGGGGGFGGGGGGGGLGGGGGGGGFGGGGGGSGGGGGGGIFGEPGDAPDAVPEEDRAQRIIDIITESVEPEAWPEGGGDVASIRYFQGVLIVRAPDFIQRQIGGYPFAAAPSSTTVVDSRYVTFTAPISIIQNTKFRPVTTTGAAGGSGFGGGSGNPAPPNPGGGSGGGKGGGSKGGSSGGNAPTKPSGGSK